MSKATTADPTVTTTTTEVLGGSYPSVSVPSFSAGVPDAWVSTTLTIAAPEILAVDDRNVINLLGGALDLIEALAPDNVIASDGPGNAAAHQAIHEELTTCAEALQKWQAQRMRTEVKEGAK